MSLSVLRQIFYRGGRLHPFWRLILYLPMLVLTAVVIILPLTLVLNKIGLPVSVFDPSDITVAGIIRRTISTGFTVSVLFVGTWIWRRFLDRRDLTSMGLSFSRRGLSELLTGIFAGFVFLSLIFLVELFMGWIHVQGWAWHNRPFADAMVSLYITVIITIEVVVKEEIITRGYLLQTLEEWMGLPTAVIISSIAFSLWHFINPTITGGLYYVVPFTHTVGGILLALLYLSRRSLWLPIGFHFAWNVCEYSLFALIGASVEYASVLVTNVTGPAFWVGLPNSSFGPEVGALGVLGELLIICILIWKIRGRQNMKSVSKEAAYTR